MSTRTEEFKVSGEKLLQQVKDLVHEGNVRRVTIKNKDGVTLFEVPLTAGVVGAVLLPVWAAIGAVAALAASYTIAVELGRRAGEADGRRLVRRQERDIATVVFLRCDSTDGRVLARPSGISTSEA